MSIIYGSRTDAANAITKYQHERESLEEKYDITFRLGDSSAGCWDCAKYQDEDGNVKELEF